MSDREPTPQHRRGPVAPTCVIAAGTQTAPGGELSLQAACTWAASEFGSDALVYAPKVLRFATLPPGPRYVRIGRLRALLTELADLRGGSQVYLGMGDRLPLVSRATTKVLVLQNANIYARHGSDVPLSRRAQYGAQRWWAARSVRRADRVVTSTATAAHLAVSSLGAGAEKVHVIPIPPIDVVAPRSTQPETIGTIALIGEARANKRFAWALGEISAWSATREAAVRVVHVGMVPDTEEGRAVRDAAAAMANGSCELRGTLPHAEAMRVLADADLLVLASRLESHGIPLSEAMASCVPVVCSDIPAFRDVGGAAPRFFSGADGTLAAAIEGVEPAAVRDAMAAGGLALVPGDGAWRLLEEGERLHA